MRSIHKVGSGVHTEWWIPAKELEELNHNIVGRIEVVVTFPAKADLAETNAGGVENGEDDPIAKGANGGEKRQELVDRENDGQVTLAGTERDALDQVRPIEDISIQEAQGAGALVVPAVRDLLHTRIKRRYCSMWGRPRRSGERRK